MRRLLERLLNHDVDDWPNPDAEILIPKTPKPRFLVTPQSPCGPGCGCRRNGGEP